MSYVCCWKSLAGSGLEWAPAEADGYLSSRGKLLLLTLSPEETATVNGLRVVGGLQVVETGDLVSIRRRGAAHLSFVVGSGKLVREPGEGRMCQLTGLRIHGESIRCRCGASYSDDVPRQFPHCPSCGQSFGDDAEIHPAGELL